MRIISPSVEYLPQTEIVSHVSRCARVCYGRESGNDEQLYNNLIKNGHWSMLRHATHYAIVPADKDLCYDAFLYCLHFYCYNVVGINVIRKGDNYYVAYNGNYALDNSYFHEVMQPYLVSPEEFAKHAPELMRYTFKVVTQISTSRELNRVSPNNIAEMSTRYVDLEDGAIARPHWMSEEDADKWNNGEDVSEAIFDYLYSCWASFSNYRYLLKGHNFKREDARGVLTLDTATTVIYTYSAKEWAHIIDLRTAKAAHPNARIIANMIKDELIKLGQGLGQELGQNI